MKMNLKQNKLVSVLLAVTIMLTVVLLPVMTVFAMTDDDTWAIQVTREGGPNGEKIDYSGYDWSSLGKNLIPDPTVSHFDVNGEYGRYAKLGVDGNPVDIDTYYWWDKPTNTQDGFVLYYKDLQEHDQIDLGAHQKDSNGNYILEPGMSYGAPPRHGDGRYLSNDARYSPITRSALNQTNCLQKDFSLTDDGSGSLRYSSGGGTRGVALPTLAADKYYVIKFNMECTLPMESSVGLCLEFDDDGNARLGFPDTEVNLGSEFANKTIDTVCFVTYTGPQKFTEPFIYMYCVSNANVYLDDFGVYEVSKEFADKCEDGKVLPGVSGGESGEPGDEKTSAFQTARTSDDQTIDYSDYDWSTLGENLVPDPTVSNFNVNGEYGRYAKFDASYNPVEINSNYWWDKYIDREYGFTKYIDDLVVGGDLDLSSLTKDSNGYYELEPGKSYGKPSRNPLTFKAPTRSPLNWSAVQKGSAYSSLTDDGTGVLRYSSTGAWRAIPLPAMETQRYYVIKFSMKSADSKNGSLELCLNYDSSNTELGPNAATVTLGSGLACGKTDTVCFVVRTGPKEYTDPFIKFYCQTETFFDDFGMYEVDKKFADNCAEGVKLPEAQQELSNTPEIGQTVYDVNGAINNYKKFKWGLLGIDLLGGNSGDKISKSTQNGEEIIYQLPELGEYTYYLVKMRADFSAVNSTDDFDVYDGDELIKNQLFDMSKLGTDENYITFIIYTGAKTYKLPLVKFWLDAGNSVTLDEFAVYKLKPSYAKMCLKENKLLPLSIVNTVPIAASTEPIDGYDFNSEGNLITDGSFEENANAEETGDAVFGSKALRVASKISFDFQADTASYYMISAWVKSENAGNVKMTVTPTGDSLHVASSGNALTAAWNKISMLIYTSAVTDYTLDLESGVAFYADGVSVVPLADTVSLACYALDSYVDGTYDPDRLESASGVFGSDSSKYSTLKSPYFAACGENLTYREAYLKYLDLCNKLGNVMDGYAPAGFGNRDNFKQITTQDVNNIIADGNFDDESYWKGSDTSGSEYVSLTNEYSVSGKALKFTGTKDVNGKAVVYKKRITGLKPNTYYYLRISGMGLGEVISDADFGFMDTTYGLELRNPPDSSRADDATYVNTYHQRNNFKCQDGTWYTRVYMFNTEGSTEYDFFIRGTTGTVYYDDIKLFEQSKAYTITGGGKIADMSVLSYKEAKFACDDKKNLIPNGKFTKGTEFWGDFNGMNKFVEVVESEGNNMLHFKGNNMAYYYLPWVDVKADETYTFSYWKKNLNGEKSRSLVVSENNPHGYASEAYSVSENYGEWEVVSVKFVSHVDNRVALGIQNLDGEAVFDNVRLFKSSDGYRPSEAEDMPVGGNTFKNTLLGTDGVAKNVKEAAPETDDEYVEEYDDEFTEGIEDTDFDDEPTEETIETITKKRRQKIIPGDFDYTWIIAAAVAGGVALIAGGVFLFIFLKRKKRKDKNSKPLS